MIIHYIENEKENVLNAIKKFIKNYKNTFDLYLSKRKDDEELYKPMNLFLIGNEKWVKHVFKIYKKKKDFDDIKSESIRLIIREIILMVNEKSLKIIPGTPISVINNGNVSKTVQIFEKIETDNTTKKKFIEASSGKNKYKFPLLIVNSMYYKLKMTETEEKMLKNINIDKYYENIVSNSEEFIDLKGEIDFSSLIENRESTYMMIQLLSKLFSLKQINNVVNEIKY